MPRLKRRRDRSGLTQGIKLYLSLPDAEGVFGGGKWRLLAAVRDTGSIRSAAKLLGRSYRKAWGDIKRAEEGLGQALVNRTRGGQEHGATVLTAFGERLLDAWDRYHQTVQREAGIAFERHVRPVLETVPGERTKT